MTTASTAAAPAPPAARPRLPLTLGRRLALAAGVPVALIVIVATGFSIVGNVGRASYPVSATFPMHGQRLAVTVPGGDVDLIGDGAPGAGRLTGRVTYSLARPALILSPGNGHAARDASVRLDCPLWSLTDCSLNARMDVPAATAVTASTGGGNMTVRGLTGKVSLSAGGGDVHAADLTGALDVSTGGGNVTVSQVLGTVSVTTGGGDVTGTGITAAYVTASSGGGNISLTLSAVPRNVSVTTGGGNVTVIVPHGDYRVSTVTAGGSVSSIPSDPHAVHVISLSTGGGDITIQESS